MPLERLCELGLRQVQLGRQGSRKAESQSELSKLSPIGLQRFQSCYTREAMLQCGFSLKKKPPFADRTGAWELWNRLNQTTNLSVGSSNLSGRTSCCIYQSHPSQKHPFSAAQAFADRMPKTQKPRICRGFRASIRFSYTPMMSQSSFTAAALRFRASLSSGVSLISTISSSPPAPSLHGTPT